MSKGTTRAVTYFGAAIFVTVAVVIAAGTAMAQGGYTCVFANDHVNYLASMPQNTVDGYLVTATSQTYIAPVETGGQSAESSAVQDIVLNPTKKILYVSDAYTADVAAMQITPGTCGLTLLGNYPAGKISYEGVGLAISPNGKWLYVANINRSTVMLMNVLPDGSLSGSKQTVSLPSTPSGMLVTPDGTTLIVAVQRAPRGVNQALSYAIDSRTGNLTLVSTLDTYGQPGGFSIDSQSRYVYMSEFGGNYNLRVIQLELGPNSLLSIDQFYDFPQVTAFQTGSTLVSANGKYLYVTNPYTATVVTLGINSVTGGLRYVATSSDGTPPYHQPMGLATIKNGQFVFTGEINALTGQYADLGILAAEGNEYLMSLGTFPLGQGTYTSGFVEWIIAVSF